LIFCQMLLAKFGDKQAIDNIYKHAVSENQCERSFAAAALGYIGDDKALNQLIIMFNGKSRLSWNNRNICYNSRSWGFGKWAIYAGKKFRRPDRYYRNPLS